MLDSLVNFIAACPNLKSLRLKPAYASTLPSDKWQQFVINLPEIELDLELSWSWKGMDYVSCLSQTRAKVTKMKINFSTPPDGTECNEVFLQLSMSLREHLPSMNSLVLHHTPPVQLRDLVPFVGEVFTRGLQELQIYSPDKITMDAKYFEAMEDLITSLGLKIVVWSSWEDADPGNNPRIGQWKSSPFQSCSVIEKKCFFAHRLDINRVDQEQSPIVSCTSCKVDFSQCSIYDDFVIEYESDMYLDYEYMANFW